MLKYFDKLTTSDWIAIAAAILPVALGALLWIWRGGIKWSFRAFTLRQHMRRYKRNLKKDVSTLTVIGRREGFDLTKVYVNVSIAKSNLMGKLLQEQRPIGNVFVLVGGPGAGKSTYVKNYLLTKLDEDPSLIPFFIRLREYSGSVPIEDLLRAKLDADGVDNSLDIVHTALRDGRCLCILDGLDEVRPASQATAIEAIFEFHAKHFAHPNRSTLIVTCRKEAFRSIALGIPDVLEVVPLNDEQIQTFANNWPLSFPVGKSADGFWNDLAASPRILEVSRSPLLLVGSLLLYTESNLGIPGERVRYLEKIKNTLVEDWALAQGHSVDPRRAAYTPILADIALLMHEQETAELPRAQCLTVIENMLPNYGFESSSASNFLDDMISKTGILVREVPAAVVFVQFTLQEFFASQRLRTKFGPNEIAVLEPKDWWREAILFTVAQVNDPTPYAQALFETSPAMGAMAVAEAPTPSLSLQNAAISLTLAQLDKGDDSAILPLVSLLRKVSGNMEHDLCDKLGERLGSESEEVSANAGLILATAGTALATETLSRYPSAWTRCLETAGYLSNTFEKLLLKWVENPNHPHWFQAATLLTERLDLSYSVRSVNSSKSGEFQALTALFPKLRDQEKDYLASQIILAFSKNFTDFGDFDGRDVSPVLSCVPFVKDRASLCKTILSNDMLSFGPYGPGLICTSLMRADDISVTGTVRAELLEREITESIAWVELRRSYGLAFAACLPTFALELPRNSSMLAYSSVAISAVLSLLFVSLHQDRLPWHRGPRFVSSIFDNFRPTIRPLIFVWGALVALAFSSSPLFPTQILSRQYTYISEAQIITIFIGMLLAGDVSRFRYRLTSILSGKRRLMFYFMTGLLVLFFMDGLFVNNLNSLIRSFLSIMAAIGMFWALSRLFVCGRSWRLISRAAQRLGSDVNGLVRSLRLE